MVAAVLAACGLLTTACGQKGPPLAPLHLVPAAVAELSARRVGDQARLRFVLPTRNENGPGRIELDRVEVYAMTVDPAAPEPTERQLVSKEYLVKTVAVRPAAVEGEPAVEGDTRPQPGATVSFDEELTGAALVPAPFTPAAVKPVVTPDKPVATADQVKTPDQAVPAGAAAAAAATPAAPAAAVPSLPRRVYVLRGVTRNGRPGALSTRAEIPLTLLPLPPSALRTRVMEGKVVIEWTPPVEPVAGYNVYAGPAAGQPLNPAPVTDPTYEHQAAKVGEEQCYQVRSVAAVGAVSIEGKPSAPQCVTPRDQFPPAAPKGLAAVPTAGQINLIWDANIEKDLAGYLVLRGDAPDGPLASITAAPIRETSYRDSTVKPGVRYIYAVVAVDAAVPANTSAQSARVEETAR